MRNHYYQINQAPEKAVNVFRSRLSRLSKNQSFRASAPQRRAKSRRDAAVAPQGHFRASLGRALHAPAGAVAWESVLINVAFIQEVQIKTSIF